jgi:hypothetical protein
MYAPGFIGLAKERAVGADGIATDLHNRNTLASRTVYMRACRTSLVIKAGKSFIQPHFIFLEKKDKSLIHTFLHVEILSPIVPRMEAVSVALSSLVRVVYHLGCLPIRRHYSPNIF